MFDSALYYVGEGVLGTLVLIGAIQFWRRRKISKPQTYDVQQSVQQLPVRQESDQSARSQVIAEASTQIGSQHNCFVLGTPENPMMTVAVWENTRQLPRTIKAGHISASHLDALVQPTIKLMDSVRSTPVETLELFFAPNVSQQLSDGTAHLMRAAQDGFHATAVDSSGIIGQAWIKVVTRIDWSQVAFGTWQVLTIVTQQKHLSSIDKRLQSIGGKLDELKDLLEQSGFAKIEGSRNYLQELVSTIVGQRYKENEVQTLSNKLEDVCNTIHDVLPLLDMQMQDIVAKVEVQKLTGAGFNEHKQDLMNLVSDFSKFASYYIMALQVIEMAVQMKCALPVDRHLSDERLKGLSLAMEAHAIRIQNFGNVVMRRIDDLSDVYKKIWLVNQLRKIKDGERYREERKEVLKHLQEAIAMVNQDLLAVQISTISLRHEITSGSRRPTRLLVTINQQRQITEIRQVVGDQQKDSGS